MTLPFDKDQYTTTNTLVSNRFDTTQGIANQAIIDANNFIAQLDLLLQSLTIPETNAIADVTIPEIPPIDYSARPSFTAQLETFPKFNNSLPELSALADVPEITADPQMENIDFQENTITAQTVSIGTAPENNVNLESITIPTKPSLTFPTVPTLNDIILPSAPVIDLTEFTAVAPTLVNQNQPQAFSYTENAYNSDLRVDLFAKILNDITNGGTGLSVSVEEDIYDRGRERQRVENERLYRETEDRFSATGFSLPTGALAAALQAVSEEISTKVDQINREITISQAELEQKNIQFSMTQATQLEGLLMDFFQTQENRSLEASKMIAQNAIDIFNTIVTEQKLKLEKYQTEASVFEIKIRSQLSAIEVYKAQIEGVKAQADVQESRISIYNAQVNGLEILMKLYATEMDSVKIQSEIQLAKVEVFKAEIEAYLASVSAEKAKVDIYSAQVESERNRVAIYSEKVKAAATKVETTKAQANVQAMKAENVLRSNTLLLDKYNAELTAYVSEIEAELKNAQLQVEAFKTEAMAFEAESNAVGMEYNARMKEATAQIDLAKTKIQKQIAIISATKDSYVALKALQEKGYEGMMNVNAQLAASALNAVNVSAGQTHSYSDSDNYSETHTYTHNES